MNLRTGLLNLPNLLTLARVAAVPVVLILLLSDSRSSGMWAAAVFGMAAVDRFYRRLAGPQVGYRHGPRQIPRSSG